MRKHLLRGFSAAGFFALCAATALGQPVARPTPVAGSVVAVKGGEELRFVREERWRGVDLKQDLIGGDALRTNSIGNLAILFADQTQIRVGRNSTLVVNEVATAQGNTKLELQAGQVWARATRGGSGVDVKTPAAVAAIRGTDWSLTVDGSGKTSLIVLEGVVELSNAQGSVTVRKGEGAVAAIGQAPTKFILVSPNDREQMLFYLTLRDAVGWLPATDLKGPALRAERDRVVALAPEARTAEDWLRLSELALSLDGRGTAADALAEASKRSLSHSQRARADLVSAMLAAAERRWSDAATLFARAERGLDADRRVSAVYGRYIAASLADPKRVQPEPATGGGNVNAAIARILVTGFRKDLEAAAVEAKAAEERFPGDARIAVLSAQLAFALNRRGPMRESLDRALSLDPQDPEVLLASGMVRREVDSDVEGSLADLRAAAAIAPGQASIWNAIGLIESDRDADREAEEAFRRAIATDPEDPVAYANLAIHLLDQSRVEEAGALIDKALEIDPDFHVAYIARGRYLLQKGDMSGAIESILAGSAANPAYSQGLLVSAIAYYQNGEIELADQALDNADRLDPNDPIVAIVRSAMAIDQYRADEAILAAREALRRSRARGGDFAGIAVNRQSGSYPVEAYRFINLNEWARFYGDRTFDPFAASSYFDQASINRPSLVVGTPSVAAVEANGLSDLASYNLILQGLFFDPLAVSGRIGRVDFLRRPFLDVEVGGGLVSRGGELGWAAGTTVQGFTNAPIPTSFSLTAGRTIGNGPRGIDRETADSLAFFVGAAPTSSDRFLLFGTASETDPGFISAENAERSIYAAKHSTDMQLGAGWSHTFAYRNVLTAAFFGNRGLVREYDRRAGLTQQLGTFALVDLLRQERLRVDGAAAAISHMVGFGDLTLRYGAEAQTGDTSASAANLLSYQIVNGQGGTVQDFNRAEASFRATRLYGDAFWRPTDWFEAQAGLESVTTKVTTLDSDTTIHPHAGIGVSPLEGQWLRAAYRSESQLPLPYTLSPVTTVGLIPNALPLSLGGQTETFALRWDAEWSPHVFTAVEYQHHDISRLELPVAETFDTLAIDKARIDRVAASANLWLTHGIGVFGTVGATSSEIEAGTGFGRDVPYVPGRFARAGLTYIHPSRLKVTVAQTFFGELTGDSTGRRLDDYWTTDASITWETPDRRLLMGLTFLNLFDTEYELAPNVPGPGRTVAATLKARF